MPEILVKLEPTQPRRWFGISTLAGLGAILLYIAAVAPPTQPVELLGLLAFAAIFLWAAVRLYRATGETLVLTREAITSTSGETLCTVAEIDSTDRGFFAFKPTNGFLIRLKTTGPRRWSPGLWWRVGKRIGIGGVTSPRQAKEMVAIIDLMLAERQQ